MRYVFKTSVKPVIKESYVKARRVALKSFAFFSRVKPFLFPENFQNILFIRVDRVGDMVLSTPAYEAIKAAYPQARLTVMASMVNAPILKNNPHVDEIIVYDRLASLTEKVRLLKGLRTRQFDLAIDPFDDYELETAWIAWMSGAGYRVGYEAYGREIFLNASMQRTFKEKNFVDIHLDLLKVIGVSYHARQPAIYLDESEQSWATQWLKRQGIQDKKPVAIHPGAYYSTQRWPAEHYADLIRLLRERMEAGVIVFGGREDDMVIKDVTAKAGGPVHVFMQGDLRRFLALLSRCRILVCNNSGPLHCAVALKVPTLSFMGPTVKERWAPIGAMHCVLRKDDLPCIGCNSGRCKIQTHDCMRLISPGVVMDVLLGPKMSPFFLNDKAANGPV